MDYTREAKNGSYCCPPWSKSKAIPYLVVGENCERCDISDCTARQAKYERIFKAIGEIADLG